MTLFLSRIHFPVTTLGFGRRAGIWFQGCSIRCPGCVSRDTWQFGRGRTTVECAGDALRGQIEEADGVTISGGEPFDQPEALGALLRLLRRRCPGDLLVFSGYPWEKLEPRVRAWNGLVDLLISDPFEPSAGQTLALRGSDNQRVHLLTPLARQRYADLPRAPRQSGAQALDVVLDGSQVWMAGIPGPGDLERLRQKLLAAGFSAQTTEEAGTFA